MKQPTRLLIPSYSQLQEIRLYIYHYYIILQLLNTTQEALLSMHIFKPCLHH